MKRMVVATETTANALQQALHQLGHVNTRDNKIIDALHARTINQLTWSAGPLPPVDLASQTQPPPAPAPAVFAGFSPSNTSEFSPFLNPETPSYQGAPPPAPPEASQTHPSMPVGVGLPNHGASHSHQFVPTQPNANGGYGMSMAQGMAPQGAPPPGIYAARFVRAFFRWICVVGGFATWPLHYCRT